MCSVCTLREDLKNNLNTWEDVQYAHFNIFIFFPVSHAEAESVISAHKQWCWLFCNRWSLKICCHGLGQRTIFLTFHLSECLGWSAAGLHDILRKDELSSHPEWTKYKRLLNLIALKENVFGASWVKYEEHDYKQKCKKEKAFSLTLTCQYLYLQGCFSQ